MKALKPILILIVVVAVLAFAKDLIIQQATTRILGRALNVPVHIGKFNLSVLSSKVDIRNIRIENPPAFKDRTLLSVPRVSVTADLGSMLTDEIHLREAVLDVEQVVVIRNADGQLNLDALNRSGAAAQPSAQSDRPAKRLKIDVLTLSLGEVIYKDYTKSPEPRAQVFSLGIKDRTYHNVTDPKTIASLIAFEAIKNSALSQIANLDLQQLQNAIPADLEQQLNSYVQSGLRDVLSGSGQELEKKAKDVLGLFK